jgi:hypothetical protein
VPRIVIGLTTDPYVRMDSAATPAARSMPYRARPRWLRVPFRRRREPQQSLPRLLPAAGTEVEADAPLPERLVLLQRLMDAGDERAALVYETVGTHLGYALLEYREFYDFDQVLLLGRVMTGQGGEVIRSRSAEVLAAEGAGSGIRFHAVSEREKRHGQAVAAASLPSRD